MSRICQWSLVFCLLAASGAGAATVDVSITGFAFSPPGVTINVGDTVRWTNNDAFTHTSTSDTGAWDSGLLGNGATYSFTFSSEGTFPYHCVFHPSMLGSVTVQRAGIGTTQQITATSANEVWGVRKKTTSRGKMMWWDGTQVWFYDGATATPIQPTANFNDPTFTLGSDSTPGHVIGAWRTDADGHAYVGIDGGGPVLVTYSNPIDALKVMNLEAVAIDDGSVFMGLNTTDANANTIALVYKVNPVTGAATLIGGTPVSPAFPGRDSMIFTSQGQAVWLDNDGTNPLKLKYYDGRTTAGDGDYTMTIDTDATLDQPVIANGKIVYTKKVNGIAQVFLYDTTAPLPAPVQLTDYALTSRGIGTTAGGLYTDGRHVAWTWQTAGLTARQIVLNGTVVVTDSTNKLPDGNLVNGNYFPFQLSSGQLAWVDAAGGLHFVDSNGAMSTIAIAPATSVQKPYLSDGYIQWLSAATGQTNIDAFRYVGPAPAATTPPLAITATATPGQVTVAWEQILGASSYNLYMARVTGVTKSNYASLTGGTRFTNATSPYTIQALPNGTYYFVVTAVENSVEGPNSREASATVGTNWSRAYETQYYAFHDVKRDRGNASILYAASSEGVWKSTDAGRMWTPLPGLVNGVDIRAVGANGNTVVAVSKVGKVYRSGDGGSFWTLVFDGEDIGEQQKSLLNDPLSSSIWYAGDTKAIGAGAVSTYVIRSIDDGANWSQLPDSAAGEIRAYALAGDPGSTIYASGSGVPVAKSTDSGLTWSDVKPRLGYFLALAAPASNAVYTAGADVSQNPVGVYKTINGGGLWTQMTNGLPNPLPHLTALVAENANNVYAGGPDGFFYTINGGANWTAGPVLSIEAMTMTSGRTLVAATSSGIFLLPLSAAPAVTQAAPSTGPSPGGTSVTVMGTNFNASPGLRVLFGGVDGPVNLAGSSSTSIQVTTPSHASGAVDVTVANPDGQSAVLAGGFTYLPCTYEITPAHVSYPSVPLTDSVSVSTSPGCSWTASAPAGFVTITSGASGTGNGTATISVQENTTGTARSVTLTIAGRSFLVNQSAIAADPPFLTAYSAGSTSVNLLWGAVSGATSYTILRSQGGGAFVPVGSATTTFATDGGLTTGTGYLYRVDANSAAGWIASTPTDAAVPFTLTDPSLTAGTPIRAAHFNELRQIVNAERGALGWPPASFTNAITVGGIVRVLDVTELRSAIDRVHAAFRVPPAGYATDPTLTPGTVIKAAHIEEMRTVGQ